MLSAVKPPSRWNPLATPFVYRARTSPSPSHPAQHQQQHPPPPPSASSQQPQIQTQPPQYPAQTPIESAGTTVTVSTQLTSTLGRQTYDAFLVLDVEATCMQGTDFHWPNEIIVRSLPLVSSCLALSHLGDTGIQEWPVCLLMWKDKQNGMASRLDVVDEFRSFVKPTWRPLLSAFCTQLTGITQVRSVFRLPLPFPFPFSLSSPFLPAPLRATRRMSQKSSCTYYDTNTLPARATHQPRPKSTRRPISPRSSTNSMPS